MSFNSTCLGTRIPTPNGPKLVWGLRFWEQHWGTAVDVPEYRKCQHTRWHLFSAQYCSRKGNVHGFWQVTFAWWRLAATWRLTLICSKAVSLKYTTTIQVGLIAHQDIVIEGGLIPKIHTEGTNMILNRHWPPVPELRVVVTGIEGHPRQHRQQTQSKRNIYTF